jgi:hypothetical protein
MTPSIEMTNSEYEIAWDLYRRWKKYPRQWFDDKLWSRAVVAARSLSFKPTDESWAVQVRAGLKKGTTGR